MTRGAMSSERKAESAAGYARLFSRILKDAGCVMADTKNKYRWTEGYFVHRIGYSGTVSVDYHIPHYADLTDANRALRAAKREHARQILTAAGYEFDDRLWFETKEGR